MIKVDQVLKKSTPEMDDNIFKPFFTNAVKQLDMDPATFTFVIFDDEELKTALKKHAPDRILPSEDDWPSEIEGLAVVRQLNGGEEHVVFISHYISEYLITDPHIKGSARRPKSKAFLHTVYHEIGHCKDISTRKAYSEGRKGFAHGSYIDMVKDYSLIICSDFYACIFSADFLEYDAFEIMRNEVNIFSLEISKKISRISQEKSKNIAKGDKLFLPVVTNVFEVLIQYAKLIGYHVGNINIKKNTSIFSSIESEKFIEIIAQLTECLTEVWSKYPGELRGVDKKLEKIMISTAHAWGVSLVVD